MSKTENLTFLLADDHHIVRQGLQFTLEDLFEKPQIFHATTMTKIIERLDTSTVDILILDAQFPNGTSLSLIPEIRKKQPNIKILIFTSFEEGHFSLKFIDAGANGFLSKLSEEHEINRALLQLIEKGYYYPILTKKLLEFSKNNPQLINPLNQLSSRELEIAKLYAKGYGNLEIANELELKQNTISTFKKRIFEKLNIESFVDLVDLMKIHSNL